MKGRSSYRVQREFPLIRKRYWGCLFCGRVYFSTTSGAITEDIVLQYLEKNIADLPASAGSSSVFSSLLNNGKLNCLRARGFMRATLEN